MIPKWSIWIYLTLVAIVVLVFGWWFFPKAIGLYYQVRGGRLLQEAIQIAPDIRTEDFLCAVEPTNNDTAQEKAHESIEFLNRAISYDPSLDQARLLLGRAQCFIGESENAIEPYFAYTQMRPMNPLGHLELGIAYASQCFSLNKYQTEVLLESECDDELLISINNELASANINQEQYLNYADEKYKQQRWGEAFLFYALEENINQPLSADARFRRQLIQIANKKVQDAQIYAEKLLTIQPLIDKLMIEAQSLQGSFDGKPLSRNPGDDPSVGVMWWNGDAITGVNIQDGGEYKFTLVAQNMPPIPIKFQLLVDFKPVDTFELSLGDMSWQEFSTSSFLDTGLHTIGVRYLNDDFVDGFDRNLYLDRLMIE